MKRTGARGARIGTFRSVVVGMCLLLPIVAGLVPAVFGHANAKLAGIPLFYWSQILLVPFCSLALLAAYRLGPGRDRKQPVRDYR